MTEVNNSKSNVFIKETTVKTKVMAKGSNSEIKETTLSPSTYQIKPSLTKTFQANKIKKIIQNFLTNYLQGKVYNQSEAGAWTKEIADTISKSVRDLNMQSYKHIVQVMIGQQTGAGCRYITRCRWDAECDNQTSDIFTNATLFCICTVFGLYLY